MDPMNPTGYRICHYMPFPIQFIVNFADSHQTKRLEMIGQTWNIWLSWHSPVVDWTIWEKKVNNKSTNGPDLVKLAIKPSNIPDVWRLPESTWRITPNKTYFVTGWLYVYIILCKPPAGWLVWARKIGYPWLPLFHTPKHQTVGKPLVITSLESIST